MAFRKDQINAVVCLLFCRCYARHVCGRSQGSDKPWWLATVVKLPANVSAVQQSKGRLERRRVSRPYGFFEFPEWSYEEVSVGKT